MEVLRVATLPVSISSRPDAVTGFSSARPVTTPPSTIPSSLTGLNAEPSRANSSNTVESRDISPTDPLAQAVEQVNNIFSKKGKDLYAAFEKDKLTGIDVVKIVDYKTNETVGQLPIKEMIKLAQLMEYQQGIKGHLVYNVV